MYSDISLVYVSSALSGEFLRRIVAMSPSITISPGDFGGLRNDIYGNGDFPRRKVEETLPALDPRRVLIDSVVIIFPGRPSSWRNCSQPCAKRRKM